MAPSVIKIWESKVCRGKYWGKYLPLFGVAVGIFSYKSENLSAVMDSLNSKTKNEIYHGTKNQYVHTCGKLNFQDGGHIGRQKLKYVYLNSKVSYKEE